MEKKQKRMENKLFRQLLTEFNDMYHEFVLLTNKIDRVYFEKVFVPFYSDAGHRAMPILLRAKCIMLKHLYNHGEETLDIDWVVNPNMHLFYCEEFYKHHITFGTSDFVHHRKRIREVEIRKIFQHSINLLVKKMVKTLVVSDKTIQENKTSFPTKSNLYKEVTDKCDSIAAIKGIVQRQRYIKIGKEFLRQTYNSVHPNRQKAVNSAMRKNRTIAGLQVSKLECKMDWMQRLMNVVDLNNYNRDISKCSHRMDKVHSCQKPHTACIVKGKTNRHFEFAEKIMMILTEIRQIILAKGAFDGKPHESKTDDPLHSQIPCSRMKIPDILAYDCGDRVSKKVHRVKIITFSKQLKHDMTYNKKKIRYPLSRRAGIELVSGHSVKNHRMYKNNLGGRITAKINLMLAANLRTLKKLIKEHIRECKKLLFDPFQIFFANLQYCINF